MCSAGRLEVHVVNPRLGKRIAEVLYAQTFYGARGQEQQLDLLVEGCRIRKSAAAARLRVKRTTSAATAAESTHLNSFPRRCVEVHLSLPALSENPDSRGLRVWGPPLLDQDPGA